MQAREIIRKKMCKIESQNDNFKQGDKVITCDGLIGVIQYIGDEDNEYAVGLNVPNLEEPVEGFNIFEIRKV